MALFLHSEWSFSEDWKLTAGARYTDESKDFAGAYTFLIAGGTEIPLYPDVVETYDTDNVSGKIGLDYTGIEDTLLYASVSRGFKSGGFQGQLSFDPAALQPFDDEEVLAYEVGMKSRLAGNSLEFNASVFFYDYEDMQFYGGLFDSPVGVLFGIANIGDAEIKGAEADLWWRPTEGLDLRFGLGYLDTEITNSVVDGVATGSELPNSPEFTFSSMARYEWAISGTLMAEVAVAARLPGQRHVRHRPGAARRRSRAATGSTTRASASGRRTPAGTSRSGARTWPTRNTARRSPTRASATARPGACRGLTA